MSFSPLLDVKGVATFDPVLDSHPHQQQSEVLD